VSRDIAHPALHTPPFDPHIAHFVPEGWEDFDRGLCPCGEAVTYDNENEMWVPDRSLRVLVLTKDEASAVLDMVLVEDGDDQSEERMAVQAQLDLQDEIEGYERAGDPVHSHVPTAEERA
jgi:hypothetical protein